MPASPKNAAEAAPTRLAQPIILIRGFGGLGVEDEKKVAYQGFNDGTVYPQKRGENFIYEGLILRFLKSRWTYADATNIVGYYGNNVKFEKKDIPEELRSFDFSFFSGSKIVIDPGMALSLIQSQSSDICKTLWVFRYYDLNERDSFALYGEALYRLITFIRALAVAKGAAVAPKINIIAHSMGGLIARQAIQSAIPQGEAPKLINKLVTLGTPHKGISFQVLQNWVGLDAAEELNHFNGDIQDDTKNPVGFKNFAKAFPPERVLTVVGTNYRTYGPVVASWLNRIFSVDGEFGANYNRSDGLVKQTNAQLPGAPRTFVNKCHGGQDSLVTSREAFEIATRFFFGNLKVTMSLKSANVKRGGDWIGKSEFFFGVGVKPRKVDFELFHQSAEAENCYGPFARKDLADKKVAFSWVGEDTQKRVIWEGWLDASATARGQSVPLAARLMQGATADSADDIVMRLDFYVGERDNYGVGFSDNVIFRRQYFARALFEDIATLALKEMSIHTSEDVNDARFKQLMTQPKAKSPTEWEFSIGDETFEATLLLKFEVAPEVGDVGVAG